MRARNKTVAALVVLQFALAACSLVGTGAHKAAQGVSSALPPRAEAITSLRQYRVGIGDELKIALKGSQSLLGIAAVGEDGLATLPRKGDTQVVGMTLGEIAAAIEKDRGGVAVTLNEPPAIFVVGAVAQPGAIAYRDGMTLGALLVAAGGATHKAELRSLWIKPRHAARESKAAFDPALPVLPGDVVRIEERYF